MGHGNLSSMLGSAQSFAAIARLRDDALNILADKFPGSPHEPCPLRVAEINSPPKN